MKICAVILNYNGWQDTLLCVESVLASNSPPYSIIIVDNASTNDSVRWFYYWAAGNMDFVLRDLGAKSISPKPISLIEDVDINAGTTQNISSVVLVRNTKNKGYAAGNNAGIRLGMQWGADAVWILNNDTVVDKKALAAMRDRLFSKQRPGLCGSLVCYMDDSALVQCRGGGYTNKWTCFSVLDGNKIGVSEALLTNADDVEARINFIYGASVMASRAYIEQVGLIDERYFLYCEEQDWAYSSKGQFDFAYAPDAIVYHKEGGSTGFSHKKFNARFLWHLGRSRILLTWKHAPIALPTVCASIMFVAIRMVWRRLLLRRTRLR